MLRCTVEADVFLMARQPAAIIRDNAHNVSCPVTFCRGVLDPMSRDKHMVAALDELARWCPRARLYTFPSLNHMGPHSHPDTVARVLFEVVSGGQGACQQGAADAETQQAASRL